MQRAAPRAATVRGGGVPAELRAGGPDERVFPDASGEEPFAGLVRARVDLARKSDPGPTHEGAAKWAREGRAATAPVSRQTTKVIVAMEDCAPRTEVGFLVAACRNFDSPRRRNA